MGEKLPCKRPYCEYDMECGYCLHRPARIGPKVTHKTGIDTSNYAEYHRQYRELQKERRQLERGII